MKNILLNGGGTIIGILSNLSTMYMIPESTKSNIKYESVQQQKHLTDERKFFNIYNQPMTPRDLDTSRDFAIREFDIKWFNIPKNAINFKINGMTMEAIYSLVSMNSSQFMPRTNWKDVKAFRKLNPSEINWVKNEVESNKTIKFGWEAWKSGWLWGDFRVETWIIGNPKIKASKTESWKGYPDYGRRHMKITVNYEYLQPVLNNNFEIKIRDFFSQEYDWKINTMNNGHFILNITRNKLMEYLGNNSDKFYLELDLWNNKHNDFPSKDRSNWKISVKILDKEIGPFELKLKNVQ